MRNLSIDKRIVLKCALKKEDVSVGIGDVWHRQGQMTFTCEHWHTPPSSKNGDKFNDYVCDYQRIKTSK
jgi:hypothetical protein